jgi:hypothetical protein
VGSEATGSMQWFLELMEELGIECRVGHPQKIRKAETRKQKHDRRDARLLLTLLAENRFPTIWMPSSEQRDLRTLLRHRHQWVRLRSRVQQINSTQPRSQERARAMEPRGPARTAGVASGSPCQRATSGTADFVSSPAGIDRRTRQRSLRRGPAASPGKTIANTSGSGADHRISHRSISGRSEAVHRWESTGQLHWHDPERTLQWRPAAAGCDEQTREHVAALSVV